MTSKNLYKIPPVVEAVLEINVAQPEGFDVSEYEKLYDGENSNFLKKSEIKQAEFKLCDQPGVDTKTMGYRYENEDEGTSVALVDCAFVFTQLFTQAQPYENWNKFKELAQSEWHSYKKAYPANATQNLKLRYINKICIPHGEVDFDDYLVSGPSVPEELPQVLNNFLLRLSLPIVDINAECFVTQTISDAKENEISLLLDIEIVKILEDQNCDIWEVFDRLRVEKNRYFELFITDKTREIFK